MGAGMHSSHHCLMAPVPPKARRANDQRGGFARCEAALGAQCAAGLSAAGLSIRATVSPLFGAPRAVRSADLSGTASALAIGAEAPDPSGASAVFGLPPGTNVGTTASSLFSRM